MATIVGIAEGLKILSRYDDGYCVGASHDEIHAGPQAETISTEDKAELKRLGWIVDRKNGNYMIFTWAFHTSAFRMSPWPKASGCPRAIGLFVRPAACLIRSNAE